MGIATNNKKVHDFSNITLLFSEDIDINREIFIACNNLSLAEELRDNVSERFDFGNILILENKGLPSLYTCDYGIIMSF